MVTPSSPEPSSEDAALPGAALRGLVGEMVSNGTTCAPPQSRGYRTVGLIHQPPQRYGSQSWGPGLEQG